MANSLPEKLTEGAWVPGGHIWQADELAAVWVGGVSGQGRVVSFHTLATTIRSHSTAAAQQHSSPEKAPRSPSVAAQPAGQMTQLGCSAGGSGQPAGVWYGRGRGTSAVGGRSRKHCFGVCRAPPPHSRAPGLRLAAMLVFTLPLLNLLLSSPPPLLAIESTPGPPSAAWPRPASTTRKRIG